MTTPVGFCPTVSQETQSPEESLTRHGYVAEWREINTVQGSL